MAKFRNTDRNVNTNDNDRDTDYKYVAKSQTKQFRKAERGQRHELVRQIRKEAVYN